MVATLITSAKLATLDLLKIKAFWNKGYDVIISVHDFTNKTLSHDLYYIVDVVMGPKFGIFMREVIITSILYVLDQKKNFFERCSLLQVRSFETGTRYGL